jgi:hypothetical protein
MAIGFAPLDYIPLTATDSRSCNNASIAKGGLLTPRAQEFRGERCGVLVGLLWGYFGVTLKG